MRLVLRGSEPRWVAPVAVLVAVLGTVALTAVPTATDDAWNHHGTGALNGVPLIMRRLDGREGPAVAEGSRSG